MKTNPKNTHGFTRTEALAALTTLLLLSLLAFPSSANNRGKTKSTLCLSNLRHLVFAWQLYATDHDGRLVGNYTGGQADGGSAGENPRNAPWSSGWLDWSSFTRDNTNINLLRDPRYARMAGYILTERNVHKCPSDKFQTPQQRTRGWHRVRSVAMNSTLGDGNAMLGPWDSLYRQARSISDLYLPTPAETTVLFDEHPDSINDPLVYAPRQNNWIDIPGNLHDGAGSFSFADGHVALRQWRTSTIRNLPVRFNFTTLTVRTGDPDITWMSYTSQRSRDHIY